MFRADSVGKLREKWQRPLILLINSTDHQRSDRGLAGPRAPAAEIEQLVTSRVRQWLLDRGSIYKATSARFPDPSTQRRLAARAAEVGKRWPEFPVTRTRA